MIEHCINPPENADSAGEALCLACAQAGTCCCKTEPELTHLSFPLSGPEWRRLLPYAALAATAVPARNGDAVRAAESNTPDFIASMRALFPREKKCIEALFPQGGKHYSLRTGADGSCVFLGKSGCRLPRLARPWYCLLFPVWVVEDALTLFNSASCLIFQKARSPVHGAALLKQEPSRIRELHRALRRDWGLLPRNTAAT